MVKNLLTKENLMKYLIVQNQKSKQLYAVVAAENNAELDRELGQLMMRQAKLVELVSEAETLPFDSADALAEHLICVSVKPKKVMNAQDVNGEVNSSDALPVEQELDSKITFGKYKFKTIREIVKSDPNWLLWANENVEFFRLSARLLWMVECEAATIRGVKMHKNIVDSIENNRQPLPPVKERRAGNPGLYSEDGENDLPF